MTQDQTCARNILAAFELLDEQLHAMIRVLRRNGATAIEAGDYARAKSVMMKACSVEEILKTTRLNRKAWVDGFGRLVGEGEAPDSHSAGPLLKMRYGKARARALYNRGWLRLLSGSTIVGVTGVSLPPVHRDRRKELLADGGLLRIDDGLLRSTQDLKFDSPSGAAQFVAGCSVSGNRDWRIEGTGLPLGRWFSRGGNRKPSERRIKPAEGVNSDPFGRVVREDASALPR